VSLKSKPDFSVSKILEVFFNETEVSVSLCRNVYLRAISFMNLLKFGTSFVAAFIS